MKKIFSVILVAILALSVFMPFLASAEGMNVPVVYCTGQGSKIYSADGEQLYTIKLPDGFIGDAVKDCMPDFLKALATNEWEVYHDKLMSYIKPIYEKIQLDNEGNPQYGSHITQYEFDRSYIEQLNLIALYRGCYNVSDFHFYIDWRLDPYENAKRLHEYIQTVKEVTGYSKVNIVSRCEAVNYMLCYLDEYKYDDINCLNLFVGAAEGADGISALFGGNIYVDSESLIRLLDSKGALSLDTTGLDPTLLEFLYSTIELLRQTYTLDAVVAMLNPVVDKLYKEVLADCLYYSYGRFPGIFSMVNSQNYDSALENIFKGRETEDAKIIEQIEHYNTNIRNNVDDILLAAQAGGVKISVFSKYGNYAITPPFTLNNKVLNDGIVTVEGTSFGAVTKNFDSKFSDAYLEKAEENDTLKYISPDKVIDASTCLFKDTTWFFYNCPHKGFPDSFDALLAKVFDADGELTVFSDSSMPQYLKVIDCTDDETPIVPLTAEEGLPAVDERTMSKATILEKVRSFVKSLKEFLPNLLKMLMAKIREL